MFDLNRMGSALGEEEEEAAALSDVEDDDDFEAAPVVLPVSAPVQPATTNTSYEETLKTALADLENERHARKAAEAAKADVDVANVRLKSYIHEVIRQRDEALRAKDDRVKQLDEAVQSKEDVIRQRDEISLQRDEILKQKDSASSEIKEVARILVMQAEKVTSMANGIKSFSGALPRVPKTSGLAAIALGFSKRVEEVIEEILRQRESALKRTTELQIQVEHRNINVAIEVSQLEASITQLREEVGKKSSDLERCQKVAAGKDGKIVEIERTMQEQISKTKQEAETMKERVAEVESRLQLVSSETAQSVECVGRARWNLLEIFSLMQPENSAGSSEDEEPSQKGLLAKGQEIVELTSRLIVLWKEIQVKVETDREEFDSTVKSLQDEKNEIILKMSAPDRRESSEKGLMDGADGTQKEALPEDPIDRLNSSDENTQNAAERHETNGDVTQEPTLSSQQAEIALHEKKYEQATSKIGHLEGNLEILRQELARTANSARLEIDRLQKVLATQAKNLAEKVARVAELNKHVESLTGELSAAEEDVARWKEAATAEAAAGEAMVEEVEIRNKEIAALNKRLAELREFLEETNSRVGSKEDMAAAAIAARTAAERSLQIADERGADLRYRIEEMSRQLEEFEQRSDNNGYGLLDMCWPWLRGRGRPGYRRAGPEAQRSAEMGELLEPLV